MQIAVLDGGFFHYTTLSAFDSANINGQFLETWDLRKKQVWWKTIATVLLPLSTIAANIPGQFIGKAPKANFRLYRTEDVLRNTQLKNITGLVAPKEQIAQVQI